MCDSENDLPDALRAVRNAITPNVCGSPDASGGYVSSLTEACMGITSGLVQCANALSDIAEAIRELADEHGRINNDSNG